MISTSTGAGFLPPTVAACWTYTICKTFVILSIYKIATKFVLYKNRHLIPIPTSSAHRSVWVLLPSVYYMLASCLPLSSLVNFGLGSWNDDILIILYVFIYTCISKAQQMSCHTACTDCKNKEKSNSPCLSLFVRKCSNIYIYIMYCT